MYTQKHHEVQKFITLSDHGYIGYAVIANKKFWDGLPGDVRGQLEKAMAEATAYANQISQTENDEALAEIKKIGQSCSSSSSPPSRRRPGARRWSRSTPTWPPASARRPSRSSSARRAARRSSSPPRLGRESQSAKRTGEGLGSRATLDPAPDPLLRGSPRPESGDENQGGSDLLLRILDRLEEILIASLMGAATVLIFIAVVHRYSSGVPFLYP